MAKPNGKAALFALALRKEMTARGLSVRALGRLSDPADPERGRRRVQRHLSGSHLPSVPSRIAYAVALELHEDHFLDDDEERDVFSPLTRGVLRETLRQELQALRVNA